MKKFCSICNKNTIWTIKKRKLISENQIINKQYKTNRFEHKLAQCNVCKHSVSIQLIPLV